MGTIYRNAYVTIVAASAATVSESFFTNRSLFPDVALPFPALDSREPDGTMWFAADPPQSMRNDRIDKRGWCLQEALLSPRCLVFTLTHSILFYCDTSRLNIGYPYDTDVNHWRLQDAVLVSTFANEDPSQHRRVTKASSESETCEMAGAEPSSCTALDPSEIPLTSSSPSVASPSSSKTLSRRRTAGYGRRRCWRILYGIPLPPSSHDQCHTARRLGPGRLWSALSPSRGSR